MPHPIDKLQSPSPPIFISGTQRSGTTLLCRMLSAHPNMYIQNELTSFNKVFQHAKNADDIIEGVSKEAQHATGKNLPDLMTDTGKKRWGLKQPAVNDQLKKLVDFFPQSKLLVLVRDGRAVASSYIKNKWGIATNAYTGAQTWMRQTEEMKRFVSKHKEKCLWVKYEDLVCSPEAELKKISEFIGEEYSDKMLNYHNAPVYYKENPSNINTFKPLNPKIITKWKSSFSLFQINVIETVAKKTLQEFGYELIGKQISLSLPLVAFYKFHQKIIGELQIQYRWRMAKFKARLSKHGVKSKK